jgi:hypothetical protein
MSFGNDAIGEGEFIMQVLRRQIVERRSVTACPFHGLHYKKQVPHQ